MNAVWELTEENKVGVRRRDRDAEGIEEEGNGEEGPCPVLSSLYQM